MLNENLEIIKNLKLSPVSEQCPGQEFLKIFNIEFNYFPSKYLNMADNLNLSDEQIKNAVPMHVYNEWQENILNLITQFLNENKKSLNYFNNLVNIKNFTNSCQPALVNKNQLENIENKKHQAKFQQLIPDSKGEHQKIVYCNSASATGRLTVVKGPNVLTMSAEYKQLLYSRFKGGKILQIDLVAAEPTIALNLANKQTLEDPYTEISNNLFNNNLDRNITKKLVISSLYGLSKRKLNKLIKDQNINVNFVLKQIKDYFNYEDLILNIKNSSNISNKIYNYYGRPIYLPDTSDALMVSYYLQSTAAESAILAFSNLLKRTNQYSVPLHIIHDALIIDCKKEYAEFLLNKKLIKLKVNNWILPAKVTLISNN
jgi:hypothetical protein